MMNPFMSASSNLSTGYQISYLNSTVVTTMLIIPSVDSILGNGDGFSVGTTEGVNEGRLDGEAVGYKVGKNEKKHIRYHSCRNPLTQMTNINLHCPRGKCWDEMMVSH